MKNFKHHILMLLL